LLIINNTIDNYMSFAIKSITKKSARKEIKWAAQEYG